jgi:hypothetical protein
MSYEQYDGQWHRVPPARPASARERRGETVTDTRQVNPGEVWEENEFWIELSWRIDPDGSLGIRQYFESRNGPARSSPSTSTTAGCSSTPSPACPRSAAAEGLTPLEYMRRYGSFEIARGSGRSTSSPSTATELDRREPTRAGGSTPAPRDPAKVNIAPTGRPTRRVRAGGRSASRSTAGPARLPDPVGPARVLLEHAGRLGLGRVRPADLHPQPRPPRGARGGPGPADLDVPAADPDPHAQRQREVARRAGPHQPAVDPPVARGALGVATGDLVRVETELGHFVVKAWVTEGIRPGVVACSHHMGRWRPEGHEQGHRLNTATVALGPRQGSRVVAAPDLRPRAVREQTTRTPSGSGGPTSACTRT